MATSPRTIVLLCISARLDLPTWKISEEFVPDFKCLTEISLQCRETWRKTVPLESGLTVREIVGRIESAIAPVR